MLELIELQKRYLGRRVLDRATLRLEKGEACALVGTNGSGKTTVLRCIVGLHHLDCGTVRVDGIDARVDPRGARARLSYMPQHADFPETLTVLEILRSVARLRELPESTVKRELALCGLTRLAERTVVKLSGGERQRVALATLLMPDVPVYLLDEPSASLDTCGARVLADRVGALREAGRTVLFTTHIAADLERLAGRVVTLRRGRIEEGNRLWEDQEQEETCVPMDCAGAAGDRRHGWLWPTGRRA
jgi:ABC-type multidrug transport system ATPase subunit